MKKSLLLMAALGICGTSFAQLRTEMTDTKVMMTDFVKAAKIDRPLQMRGEASSLAGPMKSKATGLYYAKPAGSLYEGFTKEGYGYYASRIVVPAWNEFTFNNLAEDPSKTLWHLNMYNSTGVNFIDVTSESDEKGNYSSTLEAGYYTVAPTLANEQKTDSFTIGKTTNPYWAEGSKNKQSDYAACTKVVTDSIVSLTFLDDHVSGGYGWGGLNSGFLFGSGSLQYSSYGLGVVRQLSQHFPKPISPLYVENIYLNCKSAGLTPIPEGKELTLSLFETILTNEGPTRADTPFAVLTATKDDVEGDGNPSTTQYTQSGQYYTWTVTFSNKTIDEFGIETAEPITIDKPFTLVISGIDQDGVDIGFNGYEVLEEDELEFTYPYVNSKDEPVVEVMGTDMITEFEGGEVLSLSYASTVIDVYFYGMMDNVMVADQLTDSESNEYENCNVLFVSDDGSECGVAAGDEGYFPGVYVYTSNYWKDTAGTGDEYYYLDELPDWVTEVTVDDSYYMNPSYDYPAFNIVGVKAEALPSGTKGRFVKTFVKGRGVTSEIPIIIVQGEVDPSEYLTPEEEEGDIYNFAAAAAAGENPENFNGGAAQKFAFWDIKNEKNDARQDFKGYTNYTGANLPAECHVWRRSDRINGNVKDGGLQCPNDRVMVIDGLYNGAEVTIEYTTADGKNIVYCPSTEQQNEVTINGEAAVTGVSEIASGAKVVMEKAWDGYFAFQVFKGMVITKIVVNNKSTDTGIKTVKEVATATNGSIFNLAGQRVSAPVRGQIYVKDGKKFIVK